tara:strand:- start:75 stop:437 length:363 start_codon:yes stop_codon:yes gene_type:complete
MTFWIFLERELFDLLPIFENAFGVDNLYRDYENEWEWVESLNNESPVFINARRPHNWKQGEYLKPIVITIKQNSKKFGKEQILSILSEKFKCDAFQGKVEYLGGTDLILTEKKTLRFCDR